MANVTRIKAKDDGPKNKAEKSEDAEVTRKVTVKAKNSENKKVRAKEAAAAKKAAKAEKKAEKAAAKEGKKVFFLFRPFVAAGRYVRDSFREVRQVRWPDRKATWKMTLSVVIYVLIIAAVIMLLDALFTFIFNQLLTIN
ncbi:preprotein translocase subunit SecE [Candidatus Saccharibacteria bacterium]|nr:preprotein translocase subunit SecE [Candidatus Saccharibacteria bacterium]MBP5656079.1 preprotein translocase subunit SecE [Candidatus Saccharibacteria bacterium]